MYMHMFFLYMHLWVWPALLLAGLCLWLVCKRHESISAMLACAADWAVQKLEGTRKEGV